MGNPIMEILDEYHSRGHSISAVWCIYHTPVTWTVRLSINDILPLGEGDGKIGEYKITVDRKNLPKGVECGGFERHPDIDVDIVGDKKEVEKWIKEVAKIGEAVDWACFEKKRYLTKPKKWNRKYK